MAQTGCVVVTELTAVVEPPRQTSHPKWGSSEHSMATSRHVADLNSRLAQFESDVRKAHNTQAEETAQITVRFAEIREVCAAAERGALAAQAHRSAKAIKRLEAQIDALKVTIQQYTAWAAAGIVPRAVDTCDTTLDEEDVFVSKTAGVSWRTEKLANLLYDEAYSQDMELQRALENVENADKICALVAKWKWTENVCVSNRRIVCHQKSLYHIETLKRQALMMPATSGISFSQDPEHMLSLVTRYNNGNAGIAVTSDSTLMAISNGPLCVVTVYSLPKCDVLQEFGGRGCNRGQFSQPTQLCFAPSTSNVLVIENYDNERVQEVTVTGRHVRFIGPGVFHPGLITGINASRGQDEPIIVISQCNCIFVFSYSTGDVLRTFFHLHPVYTHMCDVEVSADGRVAVVANLAGRINFMIFSILNGAILYSGETSNEGVARQFVGMCFGNAVGTRVVEVRRETYVPCSVGITDITALGVPKGRWRHFTTLRSAVTSCMSNGRLFVLDNKTQIVQVFE